jgi:hypothetical protein
MAYIVMYCNTQQKITKKYLDKETTLCDGLTLNKQNNMEEYIKLICKQGNSEIEFTINPEITLDEMMDNMECFLKAIGYQFKNLDYTKYNQP